jgi:hypothetical protein
VWHADGVQPDAAEVDCLGDAAAVVMPALAEWLRFADVTTPVLAGSSPPPTTSAAVAQLAAAVASPQRASQEAHTPSSARQPCWGWAGKASGGSPWTIVNGWTSAAWPT